MRPVTPLHGILLDLALITAVTVLAVTQAIPGSAALSMLTLIAGAKIMHARSGGGGGGGGSAGGDDASRPTLPPASPGASAIVPSARALRLGDVSITVAIGLALLALLVPSHESRA